MKIVSLVPNSAVRDARIIKQARTLSGAGHEVHIIGIQETKYPSFRTLVDNNINVYRVDYEEESRKLKNRTNLQIKFLISLVFVMLAFVLSVGIGKLIDFGDIYNSLEASGKLGYLILFFASVVVFLSALFAGRNSLNSSVLNFVPFYKFYSSIKVALKYKVTTYNNFNSKRKAICKAQSKLAIELAPDLIYCHECMALEGGAIAKTALNIPLIYDAHEFYDDLEGNNAEFITKQYKKVHKKFLNEIDHLVTVSETIGQYYEEKYSLKNIYILPNSVISYDLPEYDGRLHKKAGLPIEQNILLYQGGVSKHRKVDEIVLSGEDLPENWSVVIMGMGADIENLEKVAADINYNYFLSKIEKDIEHKVLLKKTKSYFKKISSAGGANSMEVFSPEVSSGDISEQARRSLGIDEYADKRIKTIVSNFLAKSSSKMSAPRAKQIKELFKYKKENLIKEIDEIASIKSHVHEKNWQIAQRMAIRDLFYNSSIEFAPRISFVPPVPQEELLKWTQGATLGVIPYPITSKNHWGCAPNKLWEYPLAGVPIVASPAIEIVSLIKQYGIGWNISADPKAQEFATLIKNLTRENIDEARSNCLEFKKKSNWDVHTKDWLTIIANKKNGSK